MRLRAGQSVPAGEVSVSVEDLSVSEGKEDLIPAGSSLTLSAVVENPGTDENLPEEEEQDSASSDNGAADSGTSNSGASDNRASDPTEGSGTEAEKSIVRAGDGPDAIYPAAGVLLGSVFLIGAVAFWKKKKTLSRRAGILTGAAACLGTALLAAGSASAFAGKGELNGDGNIDYTDVELLERHLIGLELLAENRQRDADMNSDGSLTVTDLSLLIRKIERTLDYEMKLSSAMERLYYEKGEDAELRFLADISYGAEIQKVTVNGKETAVEKGENGSLYAVRAETGDRVGVHEFHFTEVLLDGGQKVKTEHTERIGILKEQPEVEDFLIEELPDPLQTKVSFTLRDEDSAMVSAAMEVVNDSDGSMLMSEAVKTGQSCSVTLDGFENTGKKTITAEQLIQDNGKAFELTSGNEITLQILKEVPRVEDLRIEEDAENGQFRVAFRLTDPDRALSDHKVLIRNGEGKFVGEKRFSAASLTDGKYDARISLADTGLTDSYTVQITADQDLTDDGTEPKFGKILAEETVKAAVRFLITDSGAGSAYAEKGGTADLFYEIRHNVDGGLAALVVDYLELKPEQQPDGMWKVSVPASDQAGVHSFALSQAVFDDGTQADAEELIRYDTDGTRTANHAFPVPYKDQTGEYPLIKSVEELIDAMRTDPRGSFVLTEDLDASGISPDTPAVPGSFSGELDGNGFRIKNLPTALFQTLSGALIEDCYVTGKIQGTYDHPSLGARTGGVAGWHESGRIRTCYTKAQIIAPAKKGNGGIIGGPNTGSPVIEHSLSMSSGAGYRIAGFDVLDNVKEVYEYSGSGSETSITEENQTEVKETDAVYDRSFYEDTLKFDGNVWKLDGLECGKLPTIEGAPVEDNNLGIPGYSLVVNHTGYDPARERAYANMAKLMPLSDTRLWVEYGNSLPDNNEFVNGTVRFILPLDADGGLVSGVRRDAPEEIRKIRVVFEDGNMEEYPVTYRKLTGNLAASYEVDGTALRYQFRKYVSDIDDTFLSKAAMAAGYDYATEIAALTPEEESRLYTDYYNETVKTDVEDFLVKLYSSSDRYPTYSSHLSVKALAEERMEDEELLKRMLYAYNYYDKWYKIDYRGVSLSRLMFFDGELIDRSMTAAALAERLLTAPQGQRDTNQSISFYNNVLKNFTGEDLTDFLGGLSKSLAGYSDPNEWFTESFEGVLVEEPAYGDTDGKIRYRIWDNLSGLEEGRKSLVLQILTAPQGDLYLISVPSQLLIGSMNRYQEYLTKDGQERERILSIAEVSADKMGIFYGVSSRWMSSSEDQLNSFVNVQYDSRLGFPESEAAAAGTQEKGTTRDPVMKWVYEANNMLNALNGSAAVADGSIVIWMHTPALGTSDYIFFTFSHETAHNQDGRYFYGGAGRRKGTGGEAHADGNIAQEMRDGCMVFNISKINDIGTEMTNNFSYERIDSAEKVHSFYREMFDAGYALDYLAAQAFFDLMPEVQAAVAVQAEHTAGGTSSMSTTYRKLTAQEIGAMNLDSMEKLWDNRISIRNAGSYPEKVGTATDGSYGFESFYTMNWYQSHSDSGSPDTHSFKRLGQEMLGIAGYERGYMTYMSAISENDLDVLRKATGDEKIICRNGGERVWDNVPDSISLQHL